MITRNRWFFLSGDGSPELYGGRWARVSDHDIELIKIENAQELCGREVDEGPFCVTTGGFTFEEIEAHPELQKALEFVDVKDALEAADPEWKPLVKAEALFEYGCGVTDSVWADTDAIKAEFGNKRVERFIVRDFRAAERRWKRKDFA